MISQEAVDAVRIHVHDLEPVVAAFEQVARLGLLAERQHRQPATGVIVRMIVLGEQRSDIEGARHGVEIQAAFHLRLPSSRRTIADSSPGSDDRSPTIAEIASAPGWDAHLHA